MVKSAKIIFLNSSAQLIGKLASGAGGLIVFGLIKRSLGDVGFGEFAIISSYVALFYMAADFGFNAIVLRLLGGRDEKLHQSFSKLLGLRIVYSLGLIFLALAILSFLPYSPEIKLAAIVMSLTILTQAIFTTTNLVFQFKLRYDLSTVATVTEAAVNLGIIYLLAVVGMNLVGVAGAYVASGLAMVFVSLGLVRRQIGPFGPSWDYRNWLSLTAATLPVGLTLVANLLYFRADTFILSFYRSLAEVGIYGQAYKLFEYALVFPTFFMNAAYPLLIRAYEDDRGRFVRLLRGAQLSLAGLGIIGAITGIILAPAVIAVVFGSSSQDDILPFQILLASAPIYFLSSFYMWLMLLLRRQKVMAAVYIFGLLVNVVLNLIFIPRFSYIAAALTTGISEALILVLTFYFTRDYRRED